MRLRTWRCATCGKQGKSDDPGRDLIDHWYANHHVDPPF